MKMPPETPHAPYHKIVTGYFLQKTGYFAYRSQGTKDWLLIYTTAGMGRFGYHTLTGKATTGQSVCRPGEVVLIPPGTLHDYGTAYAARRWHLIWAHFQPRPDWAPWLHWPPIEPDARALMRLSLSDLSTRKQIESILRKMLRHATRPRLVHTNLAINALEEAILLCNVRLPVARPIDPRVACAEEFLCQHLQGAVGVSDVADAVGLSISRLSFLFRKQTGMTLQRYYERQRLDRARQLLEMTTLPIKQVAYETGFQNPFYFTLRFKGIIGSNPRAYRAARTRHAESN